MKLQKLIFRNFASYGDRDQVIEFPEEASFFLVQGSNGAGKSTIPDVMRFLWYGKVDGKNKSDLANRLNKSAYVRGEALIRGRKVVVERGISPNVMELSIDGVPYDKANAKVGPSDYLADELLEIPSYVFNNAICLSIREFKSFLKMAAKDKRALIDRIFGFQIISDMRTILGKLQSALKDEITALEAKIETSTRSYNNSLTEMERLSEKLKENNTEQIKELKDKLRQFEDLLVLHRQKMEQFVETVNKHKTFMQDLITSKSQAQTKVNGIRSQLKLYDNKQCPTCQGDLTTDFHEGIKQGLTDELKKLQDQVDGLQSQIDGSKSKEQEIETQKRSFIEKGSKIQHNIEAIRQNIKSLSNDQVDRQLESIKKIVDGLQNDINESSSARVDRSEKQSWFKILEEALGDKGIKQLAMQTIVPAFNAEIYKMMGEMHLNYQVVFDDQFDARVMHLGEEISPATLSAGESVKVDFVILISFIRLLKMKFPSINVMFLDEIFANVDQDGIYVICKILRRVTKDLGLNIFVVAHNSLPTEVFEYRIDVKKTNGFSNLTVDKLQ